MDRREWALLLGTTAATLVVAILLLRWLAPGLVGGAPDLQLVQLDERVPPFYEGVFRPEQFQSAKFLLRDPRTVNRARPFHGEHFGPLVGPHDPLGFRNRAVPAVADVVVIGDSQTYGNNALLDDNWPSRMRDALAGPSVYAMATGGWGPVQYLDMFYNAMAFRPRAVVVAWYSGNDPLDAFIVSYGSDLWAALRPDPALTAADAPAITFPPPESEWWRAPFRGGEFAFTPELRLANLVRNPVVDAGWAVMERVAEAMARVALENDVQLWFTVIPTKELAFALRVRDEGLAPPPAYTELLTEEGLRIRALESALGALDGVRYVDVIAPLQAAARRRLDLYPQGMNGHPLPAGYRVIGEAVAAALAPGLPSVVGPWVGVVEGEGQSPQLILLRDGRAWLFPNHDAILANGWSEVEFEPVPPRDLAAWPKSLVTEVDPARFGPR